MTKKIPKKVLNEIHNTIKYVWEYDISEDYTKRILLKEDTLKNALYFHIRTRLEAVFEKYNIMIFTEFNTDRFRGKHSRVDLILVQMDFEAEKGFWGDCVKNYIAVFELKFKGGFSAASEEIYKDYEKTKRYIKEFDLGEQCRYYIASIWECRSDTKWWIDKEEKWAKGKLTELNGELNAKGEMKFEVKEH